MRTLWPGGQTKQMTNNQRAKGQKDIMVSRIECARGYFGQEDKMVGEKNEDDRMGSSPNGQGTEWSGGQKDQEKPLRWTCSLNRCYVCFITLDFM